MNRSQTPVGTAPGDEIDHVLLHLDELLAGIRQDAGHGRWEAHEGSLAACLRMLRGLGADTGEIARDLAEAARCTLESTQPDASLRVLEVSRRSLGAAARQTQWQGRRAA